MNRITPKDDRAWKASPERAALLEVYRRVDALVGEITCEMSTDCCRFEVTGREPYVTPIEYAEARLAGRAVGGLRKGAVRASSGGGRSARKSLPIADDGKCTFLSDEGRCKIYSARPLGCRTFFCERATGSAPRREIADLLREIVSLSERSFEEGNKSRPLRTWVAAE